METGRVISRRYLLQRLITQGQDSAIYQGLDQVLQRVVAVKVPYAEHIPAYRAAIRATSQFSHPHIIGTYDLIIETNSLYLVQEYVDGDTFGDLLQAQLTPYEVVEIGLQICRALLYAGGSSRKVCHGDLTPAAIIRDRYKQIRVNNFALPSDIEYFSSWAHVGGENEPVSDQGLPWGQMTEARHADDTRASGLLLYQLQAARSSDAKTVEPPADGRLHFKQGSPVELCELIARAVVRQHPQYINRPGIFLEELKALQATLEPPTPTPVLAGATYQETEAANFQQFSPIRSGPLVSSLPSWQPGPTTSGGGRYTPLHGGDVPVQMSPQDVSPASPTMADMPVQSARDWQAQFAASAAETEPPPERSNLFLLLGVGLVLFVLFFVIGFFIAKAIM